MLFNQHAAGLDNVTGFAIEQPDRLDILLQAGLAEGEDRFWRIRHGIEFFCGLIHADIGRLG